MALHDTSSHQIIDSIDERFPRTQCSTWKNFPRRDNFATLNERQTRERYDENLSTDRETIAADAQKF